MYRGSVLTTVVQTFKKDLPFCQGNYRYLNLSVCRQYPIIVGNSDHPRPLNFQNLFKR